MKEAVKTKSGYLLKIDKGYLLSIDLDNTCMQYFNGSIGNTIQLLCDKYQCTYIDWEQFIESGIGKIIINHETITIIWDDFPLGMTFQAKKIDTIKFLEEIILLEMKSFHNSTRKMGS